MLDSILIKTTTDINITSVLICSLVSIVLGLIIAFTHKYTSKTTKNYLITISLLPLLVQIIILLVNGNLGAGIAIAGAFSLVRFRSLPGNSKEILVVLFAMVVGVSNGMGYVAISSLLTIICCLLILIFNNTKIFSPVKKEKILKILIPEDLDYTNVFDNILNKYTKEYTLESVKTTNLGSMFDLKYRIVLKKDINEKEFMDELRIKNGNLKIIISQAIDEVDL